MPDDKKVLVTGAAGFVGFHVCRRLLEQGVNVVGWDTEEVHYPTTLIRHQRLSKLLEDAPSHFVYKDVNIEREEAVEAAWDPEITHICHLAARAGVRESLTNPKPYIFTNVVGHFNLMEKARQFKCRHFLYASSSSVYGKGSEIPFKETEKCNQPLSLYAATKKADELLTYSYSHLFSLPATALRFFTVYGPWGRPDMAVYDFTHRIVNGEPITVFNYGDNYRAYTYISDVVDGTIKALWTPPLKEETPHAVFNIGTTEMVATGRMIELLEQELGDKKAKLVFTGPIACDMMRTCADVSHLEERIGYKPAVPIEEGISKFVKWYKEFYNVDAGKTPMSTQQG